MDLHPLFRLPAELRLAIYASALGPTKSRPLYIQRHIYSWTPACIKQPRSRNCHALLLVCRHMHQDIQTLMYAQHELQLYTAAPSVHAHDLVRTRICRLEEYDNVLLHVQRLRLKIFVERTGQDALLALMGCLKAVLSEREVPLKSLHIEMCALDTQDHRGRTAMLYAAQGFRSFGLTTFQFHGGFSGVGSEDAMEALMAHASKEERLCRPEVSKEKALQWLEKTWADAQPVWWYDPRLVGNQWLQKMFSFDNVMYR